MRYLYAGLALALAGIMGGLVFTDTMTDGGSSKTRAVKAIVNATVDQVGATSAVWGIFALGLAAAAVILWSGHDAAEGFGGGRRDWPARGGD